MNNENNNENNESALVKLKEWYTGIPLVTRTFMTLSFAIPLLMQFGFLQSKTVALIAPAIYEKLQIWRLFTHFFVGKLSFGFLMNLYFLYQSLIALENQRFYGHKADYVWFFVFGMLVLDFIGVTLQRRFEIFFLPQSLMFYIMYYWSQTNRNSNVTFMFGFQFKAVYFPFVLILFDLLTGGGFDITKLFGIGVGHLYFFLKDIWPNQYGGREFLATPNFIKKLFPEDIEQEEPEVGPTSDGKYKWGSGHKLN
jgi:hypothetical protein